MPVMAAQTVLMTPQLALRTASGAADVHMLEMGGFWTFRSAVGSGGQQRKQMSGFLTKLE